MQDFLTYNSIPHFPFLLDRYTIKTMSYSRTYQGIIWTNHALERLKYRKIPQEYAWKAFRFPDSSHQGKTQGSHEFVKSIQKHMITTIAKQNDRKEWIILSAWIDPPFAGSIDLESKPNNKQSILSWILRSIYQIFYGK